MYLIFTQKPNMYVQLNILIFLLSDAYYRKCL